MAKGKDPAFLFYPADASEDTQFMNRLERGCYFDLLKAQKKFRRFTLPLIQKVLGADFAACWPAIESVLRKDGEVYMIGWADDAIENRAEHSAKQKKRIQEYWDKKKQTESIPDSFQEHTTEQPKQSSGNTLENENAIVNENAIEDKEKLKEYDDWTQQIIDGNDHHFEQMFMREGIPPGEHIQFLIMDHRDLLNRYPKMRPPTQDAFRKSCLKHIRENFKKPINGTSKTKQQRNTESLIAGWNARHGPNVGEG